LRTPGSGPPHFNQVFHYQTGNGQVLSIQSCAGTFSGYSFAWTMSWSNQSWVASGQGNCYTTYTGHLLYYGSNMVFNKQMYTITNGAGVVAEGLYNI